MVSIVKYAEQPSASLALHVAERGCSGSNCF